LGLNQKQTIAVRPKGQGGADYEDFEEDIDDIGDGGFEDETIGHREGFRQPRNRRDFENRTWSQFGQRRHFHCGGGHDD